MPEEVNFPKSNCVCVEDGSVTSIPLIRTGIYLLSKPRMRRVALVPMGPDCVTLTPASVSRNSENCRRPPLAKSRAVKRLTLTPVRSRATSVRLAEKTNSSRVNTFCAAKGVAARPAHSAARLRVEGGRIFALQLRIGGKAHALRKSEWSLEGWPFRRRRFVPPLRNCPLPAAPTALGQGDHLGRSPDSRVIV